MHLSFLFLCPFITFMKVKVFVDYLQTYGLKPTRLLCLCNSPVKNTRVGCQTLLQGFFRYGDQTQVSCYAGRFFTIWITRKVLLYYHINYASQLFHNRCLYILSINLHYFLQNAAQSPKLLYLYSHSYLISVSLILSSSSQR